MPGKSHGWRSLIGYSPWDPQRVGHDWETWRTYLKPPNCLLCYFENSESSRPHYKGSLYYTPFPTQGSNPSLMSPALAGGFFTNSATWEARVIYQVLPNCLLKTSGNCPFFLIQEMSILPNKTCSLKWSGFALHLNGCLSNPWVNF